MNNAPMRPSEGGSAPRPSTLPADVSICLRAFGSEHHAREVGHCVCSILRELGRWLDLSRLDAVTVAHDYRQALLDLDRGVANGGELTPSDDNEVVGIAMTTSVLREGVAKSHMVLNAAYVEQVSDSSHKFFAAAIHTIAHECAHVEINHRFDAAFPGVVGQPSPTLGAHLRWRTILTCWDEYAATRLSAGFGEAASAGYETCFVRALAESKSQADACIVSFGKHGDVRRALEEVHEVYSNLLKLAAYQLGDMHGHGLTLTDLPRTAEALANHWFMPYYERLAHACELIMESYGTWSETSTFEVIGALLEDLMASGGLHLRDNPDGGLHVWFSR